MTKLTCRLAPALVLLLIPACDDGIEPVPFQGVSGQVRFQGEPPDSTEWVRLAVYSQPPSSTGELIAFVAFSDTLALSDSAFFAIPLEVGTYRWMPAVWKGIGTPVSVTSLRVIGWHTDGTGPFAEPATFDVVPDRETAGIDFTATFDTLLNAAEALARLEALR